MLGKSSGETSVYEFRGGVCRLGRSIVSSSFCMRQLPTVAMIVTLKNKLRFRRGDVGRVTTRESIA